MTNNVDRRTVLKGAAAAAAVSRHRRKRGRGAGRTHLRRTVGLFLRSPQGAGAREGARPLRAAAAPGARHRAEDQLRGMGQDPLSPRPRVVRRRPRPLSGHLLPPRPVLPEGRRHVRGRGRPGAEDRLRSILFRHARQLGGARPAAGRRLRRPAHPGGARRRARLAQERLGRLSRRRLFPRHRRTAPIRPVGARHRARRRGRRPPGGVPRLHPILCRLAGRATTR